MVDPGQDIAVKDPRCITRDQLGQKALSSGDDFSGSTSGLLDDGDRYAGFHPTQLAVESGQ